LKKNLGIIINGIVLFLVLGISVLTIVNHLGKSINGTIYLTINSDNREYIETTLTQKGYELKGTITKIIIEPINWDDSSIYLLYEDGEKDYPSDIEVSDLESYIRENGYDEGEASSKKVQISFLVIIAASIYWMVCVIKEE